MNQQSLIHSVQIQFIAGSQYQNLKMALHLMKLLMNITE